MDATEHFYREWRQQFENDRGPQFLHNLRQSAMDRFQATPFPTTRDEEWRFTNIAPVLKVPFTGRVPQVETRIEDFLGYLWSDSSPRIVFVDNRFSEALSSRGSLPAEVQTGNLIEFARSSDRVQEHLARHISQEQNAFVALNTSFLNDGAYVYVPPGIELQEPIHLLFITTQFEDIALYPRILIEVDKGSSCSLLETHLHGREKRYLSSAVTEIVLGQGAILEHCKIQQESSRAYHFSATQGIQARDSSYASFLLTLGALISRNELNVALNGIGSNCELNGIYLLNGDQLADHHTLIDHAQPHGTSQELYKGILGGASRGVFNGRIIVRKDAMKTDARQLNKNLLLSDSARVNTKPQLEILADDVKCTHGAAIGHLEQDALFYLKSRGISDSTARTLLMYGFVREASRRIRAEATREKVDTILMDRLRRLTAA